MEVHFYSTLFYAGYPLDIEELKNFRQLNSRVNGHPELNPELALNVLLTFRSRICNCCRMCNSRRISANNVNKELFNHYTYVLVSDGDLMEGISYEAASLAGTLKLLQIVSTL